MNTWLSEIPDIPCTCIQRKNIGNYNQYDILQVAWFETDDGQRFLGVFLEPEGDFLGFTTDIRENVRKYTKSRKVEYLILEEKQ